MKLIKVNYSSAVFFGIFALVMYLITGLLQVFLAAKIPGYAATAATISPVQILVTVPLIGAVVAYIFAIAAIYVYNWIAKSYPISWETKK